MADDRMDTGKSICRFLCRRTFRTGRLQSADFGNVDLERFCILRKRDNRTRPSSDPVSDVKGFHAVDLRVRRAGANLFPGKAAHIPIAAPVDAMALGRGRRPRPRHAGAWLSGTAGK